MSMRPKGWGKALKEEPKAFEDVNSSQYKALEICEKKTNAKRVVTVILYFFATSLMLDQRGGCCEKFEEEFLNFLTRLRLLKDELLSIAWNPYQ